jgi:hypothetical protein
MMARSLSTLLSAGITNVFGGRRRPNEQPSSCPRRRSFWAPTARPECALALGLACAGLLGTLVSCAILFDIWYAQWQWLGSDDHRRLERELELVSPDRTRPDGDILELGGANSGGRTSAAMTTATPPAIANGPRPTPGTRTTPAGDVPPRGLAAPSAGIGDGASPRPTAVVDTRPLEVVGAELRFLDPPRPGARVSLGVTLKNRSDAPSRAVVVGIPTDWFERHDIIGAIPAVLDDRVEDDGFRYFEFPGPDPGGDAELTLHVVSLDGEAGAPTVRLASRDGESIGELRPEVVGPDLPSGPVRVLGLPRLGIRTGVVETAWDPPPFVAGQIGATAALGEGNAVVVGHRGGRGGDVFARLVGARLGDEVVAASRGAEHRYVVSEIRILPGTDSTPTGPTETPRLTLMTCVGAWNPLTGDYSHRLWVIAEPPDLARATLAETVARANQTAATASSPLEVARARTDAAVARAALAVMQTADRRGRP